MTQVQPFLKELLVDSDVAEVNGSWLSAQGFCKALMRTIERQLRHLGVERLVLPTSKDTESIWMNKFGFTRMEDAQVYLVTYNHFKLLW